MSQGNDTFTISVIIPTYNRAYSIGRALESVVGQNYPAHEIIVVDDGSTDETADVLNRFSLEHPHVCVRSIYQSRRGASSSRNLGIAAAIYNWLAFLDSDDCWLAQKLELQVKALRRFGPTYGLCFTDAVYLNNARLKQSAFQLAGKRYKQKMGILPHAPEVIARGLHAIHMPTVVIRRDVACQIGGFDPELQIYEDDDFVFRASLATGTCFVNEPLVQFDRRQGRQEGLTELCAKEDFRLQQSECEHKKWLSAAETLTPQLRKLICRRLQHTFAGWGSYYAARGEAIKACDAIRAGLRYYCAPRSVIKLLLIKCFPRTMQRCIGLRYQRRVSAMFGGLCVPGSHPSA